MSASRLDVIERDAGVCRAGTTTAAPCEATHHRAVLTPQLATPPFNALLRRGWAAPEPILIVVMRQPIERLIARFNSRRPSGFWSPCGGGGASTTNGTYAAPLDQFRDLWLPAGPCAATARQPQLRLPSMACVLAGERLSRCLAAALSSSTTPVTTKTATANTTAAANITAADTTAADAPADATANSPSVARVAASHDGWQRQARQRLRSARTRIVLVEAFEAAKRALCLELHRSAAACDSMMPRQLPIVLGGEESPGESGESPGESGLAADGARATTAPSPGGGGGNFLTREALQSDRPLLRDVRSALAVDLSLYAMARKLVRLLGNQSAPAPPAATTLAPPAPPRQWADDFLLRASRLRRGELPGRARAVLFTHVPKCAGSSFRNQVLLT